MNEAVTRNIRRNMAFSNCRKASMTRNIALRAGEGRIGRQGIAAYSRHRMCHRANTGRLIGLEYRYLRKHHTLSGLKG